MINPMDCPYKSIGIVDKCIGSCKPLETIYTHSGLTFQEARYSSRNVLGAYAAITLDDIARDGKIIVRSFARKFRNKLGKLLSPTLNQYITTINQRIAIAEKSNVGLEEYLYTTGKAGGNIFNLATAPGSNYDKNFVTEAGRLSTQMMVMTDMKRDLPEDLKSEKYNPLKIPKIRNKFDDVYVKTRNDLKSLMERGNFQNIVQKFDYKGRNLCSNKKGSCDTKDVIKDLFYGSAINCWASLIYLRAFDLKNFPVITCEYGVAGKDWQWTLCESQQTTTNKCGCVYPEWYLWFLIGLLPFVTLAALTGLADMKEDELLFRQY